MTDNDHPLPPPVLTGLRGLCPRCGRGHLFKGYLTVPPACEVCGLDFSFADAGDGPAVFVILIAGFLVLGFALWLEFTFSPPLWVHVAISLPVLIIVCGGLLRVLKGILICLQYAHDASEGRLDR
ncbi:membrane protein [Terrihabitans soli]|uniref:Membrane protein n=1 Tax=Terrihabitans soli TaxID=708113 RepID=A0A6S6QVN6_9HYPH|nr:DUF983 domain-containing protein [Terrihabitans soli]BCJ91645.1 membrane protein [Terrihabitans soli]